jgi:hypothetical protein
MVDDRKSRTRKSGRARRRRGRVDQASASEAAVEQELIEVLRALVNALHEAGTALADLGAEVDRLGKDGAS